MIFFFLGEVGKLKRAIQNERVGAKEGHCGSGGVEYIDILLYKREGFIFIRTCILPQVDMPLFRLIQAPYKYSTQRVCRQFSVCGRKIQRHILTCTPHSTLFLLSCLVLSCLVFCSAGGRRIGIGCWGC